MNKKAKRIPPLIVLQDKFGDKDITVSKDSYNWMVKLNNSEPWHFTRLDNLIRFLFEFYAKDRAKSLELEEMKKTLTGVLGEINTLGAKLMRTQMP